MHAICLAIVTLSAVPADNTATFIARVENTELRVAGGTSERVKKDANGDVIQLRLDGMNLTAEDFRTIGDLESLLSLSLRHTNVANEDLRCLRGLKNLRGLVLSSTEVSDAAIDEVVRLDGLRSTCLGDVLITPDAVGRLKAAKPKLAIGYTQRKQPTR